MINLADKVVGFHVWVEAETDGGHQAGWKVYSVPFDDVIAELDYLGDLIWQGKVRHFSVSIMGGEKKGKPKNTNDKV